MAQISALVQALKTALKAAGLTYAEVAASLGLSESSVKRKFSRQDFSLSELDQIFVDISTEISERVKLMEEQLGRIQQLTKAQDFFAAQFEQDDHQLIVLNSMLSSASNAEFQRKVERLSREFDLLNQEDNSLPLDMRQGYSVALALRDWRYRSLGLFDERPASYRAS